MTPTISSLLSFQGVCYTQVGTDSNLQIEQRKSAPIFEIIKSTAQDTQFKFLHYIESQSKKRKELFN